MLITKKRIRSSDAYLSYIPETQEFKAVADVTHLSDTALQRLGFSTPLIDGETILPNIIGPVARFNSDGRFKVRRDLSKEERYIRTVQWTWKQWAGRGHFEEHTEFRDIHQKCYPRDRIEPPSLELTMVYKDGKKFVTTKSFSKSTTSDETRTHAINLMLELFGSCSVVITGLTAFQPPVVKKVNWKLLPMGDNPWDYVQTHVKAVLRKSPATEAVIWDRQVTVKSFAPDEIAVGLGGFDDYLAYIFKSAGVVVLESIRKDNAIYIFDKDWKLTSQLTKADIIRAGLHKQRIVHTIGWKEKLARALRPPNQKPSFGKTGPNRRPPSGPSGMIPPAPPANLSTEHPTS